MAKTRQKAKKEQRASLVPEEHSVLTEFAEFIYNPAPEPGIQFAVYSGGKVEVRPTAVVNGTQVLPPSDPHGLVAKGTVLLPSCAAPYGSQKKLVWDIKHFIHRYADVPDSWAEIIAHYVLMTWVYDAFSALPYLRFLGEPETGKSRLLQVVGHLCYRAITVGAGITISPFFRLLDFWHGTFLVDEADLSSESSSDLRRILNAGYMKGLPLIRSETSGDSFEARTFDVYSPKIIADRSRSRDAGLETRFITLQTVERPVRKSIPRQLPSTFSHEAQVLRNKLLQYRFKPGCPAACGEREPWAMFRNVSLCSETVSRPKARGLFRTARCVHKPYRFSA